MRKNLRDALNRFGQKVASPRSVQGGSVWTDGRVIYSYSTPLLMITGGRVVLNVTRYSVTTTIHQNALRVECAGAVEVDGLERGCGVAALALAAEQVVS
jgi:hypothetical protein